MGIEKEIREHLFSLEDLKYKEFQCKLMPTVNPETVIGVRTPELRKYARQVGKRSDWEEFLQLLPHAYYEENNLHGFLISGMKDYEKCIQALDIFLPYVDNWATCDFISPKIFKKHLHELLKEIKRWIESSHPYTVRFAIEMLMSFYLDEEFSPEYLKIVGKVRSEEYYVNMMVAWYFATALAKQYASTVIYLEEKKLDAWCHNKTIQKAVESYRITEEQKAYLRTLRIK